MSEFIFTGEERILKVASLAARMAPAFRDKYDFSDPKDYDGLAERAWLAAEALTRKEESVFQALDEKKLADEKARAEKEAKK